MERGQGPMRRKRTSRAAGHAALTVESKREGNIQNGGREGPFSHKISQSTILGVDERTVLEERTRGKLPSLTLNAVCIHVWLSQILFPLLKVG